MVKSRKKYNWKAREQLNLVAIDNTEVNKIKVLLETREEHYDDSNKLILPSAKKKTKKVKINDQPSRILSRKQRIRLKKIIEKKEKAIANRALMCSLSKVQVNADHLNQMTSITTAQTIGRKRLMIRDVTPTLLTDTTEIFTSVADSKRPRKIHASVNKVGERKTSEDFMRDEKEIEINNISDNEASAIIDEEQRRKENENVVKQVQYTISIDKKPVVANQSVNAVGEKAVWVPLERKAEIQKARLKLPILAEEQLIMEMIHENDVVIVAGGTGCGKTTQLPQFLYEAGFARDGKKIGVTQPRRVAAIAMSKRVAEEMNLSTDIVSYLIRFEANVTDRTQIKFMTDGVLLRELQTDFLLSKYSVVILDEAHERNANTDILIGLLSRILPLRRKREQPLKLIVMSATLRLEDFTENGRLFPQPPPVVHIPDRQFPVSIHFSRRTEPNYLQEAFRKVSKIHAQLPEGGILVFVTGKQEVNTLVRRLRAAFPMNSKEEYKAADRTPQKKRSRRQSALVVLPKIDLDEYSVVPTDDTEGDRLEDAENDDDDEDLNNEHVPETSQPLWVLPFYSLLPVTKQTLVLRKHPVGCRLCIVSTNIAETSLTIPDIKYVVDSGREKVRLYDKLTGVSTFKVTWCSKSSANQRAGRAGRVGPGHCYRLYSSAFFNDNFEQFSPPEIQQKPLDSLILQMKAMNIVKVVNFPFPSRPDPIQLLASERRLQLLGAIEKPTGKDEMCGRLTRLGHSMAAFPVAPRYGKMLALSHQHSLLPYVVCLVAALSVPEVFVEKEGDRQWAAMRRAWAGVANSFLLGDAMVLLRAVGAAECTKEPLEHFCAKYGIRHKAIIEIRKLRVQLTNQINLNVPGLELVADPHMKPPSDTQAKLLREIVLSGLVDQVAKKVDPSEFKETEDRVKWKRAYKCGELEEPVFLRSTSVLSHELPEWVVYQEVYESDKLYMRGVTAIEPQWLLVFAPSLCNVSDPLTKPPPRYDSSSGKVLASVTSTFGKAAIPLPTAEIPYTSTIHSYKWFAKFLLEGEVCPKLQCFTSSLLSSPSTMIKSWSKLQPRTEVLLIALVSREVNTRQKLLEAWMESPMYLLSAYQTWVPESAHLELTTLWPPL